MTDSEMTSVVETGEKEEPVIENDPISKRVSRKRMFLPRITYIRYVSTDQIRTHGVRYGKFILKTGKGDVCTVQRFQKEEFNDFEYLRNRQDFKEQIKFINYCDQNEADSFLSKFSNKHNKSRRNTLMILSILMSKAASSKKGVPLYQHLADLAGVKEIIIPVPAMTVIIGGSHAGNKICMKEFIILPTGATSFADGMKMGCDIYHILKNVIQIKFGMAATGAGDEGGFAPDIQENKEGLELIKEAIEKAGYTGKIEIGMDVAASEFHKNGKYDLDFKNPNSDPSKFITPDELGQLYLDWIKEYPIAYIEDPFDKNDWDAWTKYSSQVTNQVVGDDLTVTNPERIQTAVDKKACNCLLLNISQIGSVTEAIKVHNLAKANGWGTMVSHRSGETEDAFISDLVVGLSIGQIKTGAPCQSELLAKYQQILSIEEELGDKAKYAGKNFRHPV